MASGSPIAKGIPLSTEVPELIEIELYMKGQDIISAQQSLKLTPLVRLGLGTGFCL